MDVILLERVEKLGQMGEVVTVKPGYARNYLLPRKIALRATRENIASFETLRTHLEAENLERRGDAESVAARMDGLAVVLTRQAADNAQLYGSVNRRDIAAAVAAEGFTIAASQVALDRPIKTVGLHPVRVRLHPEVFSEITVNVARSREEAEAQALGRTIGEDDEDEPDFAGYDTDPGGGEQPYLPPEAFPQDGAEIDDV